MLGTPHTAAPPPRGFTLVELLVVISIIVLVLGMLTPVLRTDSLEQSISSIAGSLEQARAYAMANNTYVYVGLVEEDVSKAASATPQTPGTGRVAVAAVASRDGTRRYGTITPDTDWSSGYNSGANLTALGKLQHFDNLHIPNTLDAGGQPPTSGPMARPSIDALCRIGNTDTSSQSATPFDWPLGSALGAGQYHFVKVIQFDPQGIARMPRSTDPENIVAGMEISLQPTHGTSAPPVPQSSATGNHAVIQIDGMSGSVRIYRP